MPSMYSEPCAKFTIRVTPKISDSPTATRNSVDALASPFRNWMRAEATAQGRTGASQRPRGNPRARTRLFAGTDLLDLGLGRQELRAVGVRPRGHHALAVLHADPTDIGAHRGLVVERAVRDPAERRVDLEALHRRDELFIVEAPRLLHRRHCGHDGRVADHRTEPRVVVPPLLIRGEE